MQTKNYNIPLFCRLHEKLDFQLLFIVEEAAQQGCTWETHNDAQLWRGSGLWFWFHSGPERLKHSLPLSENGLTASSPLARSSQTVLIWSAWTQHNLQCQAGVPQQEPQNIWSNPHLLCQRVQVRDVVHLNGVTLWAGKSMSTLNKLKWESLAKCWNYINSQ